MEHYDVIVVSAGPSGLSAGNTTKRYGLETVVFEADMHPRLLNLSHHLQHLWSPSALGLVQEMSKEADDLGLGIRAKRFLMEGMIQGTIKRLLSPAEFLTGLCANRESL